jgi:hypothetical protein
MPALLGKDLYVDTYVWSFIISYPLFVRRNFVVFRHVSSINKGVPRVAEHFYWHSEYISEHGNSILSVHLAIIRPLPGFDYLSRL